MAIHPRSGDLPFRIKLDAMNKGVGYVALLMPVFLLLVAAFTNICFQASISHFYFTRIGGDIFVGALVFIGLAMGFFYGLGPDRPDGYLGFRWYDPWLVRLVGVCAILIAFVPTTGSGCLFDGEVARVFLNGAVGSEGYHPPGGAVTGAPSFGFWASFAGIGAEVPIPLAAVHFGAAAVMFLILAYFSYCVFTRENSLASRQDGARKARRNLAYRVLGVAILAAVVAIGVKSAALAWALPAPTAEAVGAWWDGWRLTFWFEALALVSFGASWMIKGRFWDGIEDQAELDWRRKA